MKTHELKIHPRFYRLIEFGRKDTDTRKNDRDFQLDDVLVLREWDPTTSTYTGRDMAKRVAWVESLDGVGLPGFVEMGLGST